MVVETSSPSAPGTRAQPPYAAIDDFMLGMHSFKQQLYGLKDPGIFIRD